MSHKESTYEVLGNKSYKKSPKPLALVLELSHVSAEQLHIALNFREWILSACFPQATVITTRPFSFHLPTSKLSPPAFRTRDVPIPNFFHEYIVAPSSHSSMT